MTLGKKEYLFLGNWMELRLPTEIFSEDKRGYLLRSGQGQSLNSEEKEVRVRQRCLVMGSLHFSRSFY